MSVEWFDLGQRLAAAVSGRVVPRLVHAPVVVGPRQVAVVARLDGGRVRVEVASEAGCGVGEGVEALRLLGSVGVAMVPGGEMTLLCDGAATLTALREVARLAVPGTAEDDVAAVVAWWLDRADFPGGVGVVDVVEACRSRWVTGETPEAEREVVTWLGWLGVTAGGAGACGVRALSELVSAGSPLPGLEGLELAAVASFESARRRHVERLLDWRMEDSPVVAALGLRARCEAAEDYEAALLADPLWQLRGVHSGEVVVGVTVEASSLEGHLRVASDRLANKLRPGDEVAGFAGVPGGTLLGGRFGGSVTSCEVVSGRLLVGLQVGRPVRFGRGEQVMVMAAPPVPGRRFTSRRAYSDLLWDRYSWVTTGRRPSVVRRTVPLDVVVAGAED